MATKKKVVARRRPAPSTEVAVFTTDTSSKPSRGEIQLYINGEDYGNQGIEGRKILDFANDYAREHGIRTYSLYLDGNKVRPSQGGQSLSPHKKIEIVAKDSRG